MKDKEKQIEEISAVITTAQDHWKLLRPKNKPQHMYVAERVFEKYQPRLPEDSVILSREEYEELNAKNKELNEEIDIFNHLCNEWVKINNKQVKEIQHLETENEELKNQLESKVKETERSLLIYQTVIF